MGFSYQIDREQEIVLTRGFGLIENDDLLLHSHKLKQDPAFNPHYNVIIDLTDVKRNNLTKDIVKESLTISPFSPETRRAIVAPEDREFDFINDKQRSEYSEKIRAFRKLSRAKEWVVKVKAGE